VNDYLQQIEEAIRAVSFHSSTSYSWFGQPSPPLDPKAKRALTLQAARGYLLYSLKQQLYRDFYCQGFATPQEPEFLYPPVMIGMTPFVQVLSTANCGAGCYEDGWKVRAIEDGNIVVQKDHLQIWAPAEDCFNPKGTPITQGMQVRLRFPKELLNMSPGFYMVLGNKRLPDDEAQVMVRFYWNLTAEGAVPFVKRTTILLNQALLPFRLKVLRDPTLYRRCDAAVVYVLKRDYNAVSELLASVYREVAPTLKKATPAFTKPLAPGLGLAENVGDGESFGEHRCRLFAHALIYAYELGQTSLEVRLQTVVDCFAEENISLDAPFLSPDSTDEYHFCVST
jgi:hypothetical protein